MDFGSQKVIPSFNEMKYFDYLLNSSFIYIMLMESHINHLEEIVKISKSKNKKIIIHADFIHGLDHSEHGAEFLSQKIKPAGVISTRANFISTVKKNNLLAIQRLFLIDSIAINKSYKQVKKSNPDYIEVLPGLLPQYVSEVKNHTGIPVISGGLIRTVEDVEKALEAGSVAVSTTEKNIWEIYAD